MQNRTFWRDTEAWWYNGAMVTRELPLDSLDLRYAELRSRRPVAERRLLASLGDGGQQSPAVVVPDGAGRYIVIDGHKRVRALRALKADALLAMVWEMPAVEALVRVYQMKTGAGWNAVEEGWLIWELVRKGGMNVTETGRKLERSKGWVSGRLGLVETLPEGVQAGVRAGKIGGYVATRHLLPFARANAGECERLAESVMAQGLCSREVGTLCRYYGTAAPSAREKMLADPSRFLKAVSAAKVRGLDREEDRCWKNLELIGRVSLVLARDLTTVLTGDTQSEARSRLWPVWQASERRWTQLAQTARTVWGLPKRVEAS